MGVTLKQIAELAGVHKSTVDKVIHNRPGVSDAKRQQIRALLDEYGYESNPLAKALNYQKKKMKVAVVLPEVDAMPDLKRGIELVKQDFNSFNIEIEYHITAFNATEQAQVLHGLCTSGISGAVVLPIEAPEVVREMRTLQDAKIPVIAVNSDLYVEPYLCFVGQDMQQAAKAAARMIGLFKPEGSQLGIISSNYMRAVKQREYSFRDSLPQLCPNIELKASTDIEEVPQKAYDGTAAFLQQNPELDALFITCGRVVDICRAVREQHRDMTIVCFERYDEIAELVRNGEIACTISGDLTEQGRAAMRFLFEYLVYDKEPANKRTYIKNEICIRENM